jgi:cupin 2 domain-containing protein
MNLLCSENVTEEAFTELLQPGSVRIEWIVSNGHASSEGFWYAQDEHKWVLIRKHSRLG